MNDSNALQDQWQRSTTRRLMQWLFSWKGVRVLVIGVASLVTLIALFYTIELWRGQRAWVACQREMTAKGESLELAAFVPPTVPNEQNFAMTPLLAPLFDFLPGGQTRRDPAAFQEASKFAPDLPHVPGGGPAWRMAKRTDWAAWQTALENATNTAAKSQAASSAPARSVDGAKVALAVLDALKPTEAKLAELRAASQRPFSRFNIRYEHEDPAGILLPHLAPLKRCVEILALRSSAELALGQTEPALNDLNLCFYLTDAIQHEPLLISHLVRCADIQMLLQPVWEGLAARQWSEPQLQTLQKRLQHFDFLADSVRALKAERAFGNAIITQLRNKPETLAFLGEPNDRVSQPVPPACLYSLIPRGWFYQEQVSYNRLFQERGFPGTDLATRRVDPQLVEQNRELLERSLRHGLAAIADHRILSAMLLPALGKVHQKFAFAQVSVNEATIACALERYRLANGRFPETLEALVPRFTDKLPWDIIGGAPLRYRRTDDGQFILYSIGWNAKDDGGEFALNQAKTNVENNQGDWVWRYR